VYVDISFLVNLERDVQLFLLGENVSDRYSKLIVTKSNGVLRPASRLNCKDGTTCGI
jgi:hypothetical protein